MLRTPNFVENFNEIKEVLTGMSLFGHGNTKLAPDNIAELSKKLEESI